MERSGIAVRVHAFVGNALFLLFMLIAKYLFQWISDAVFMLDPSFNIQVIKATEPQQIFPGTFSIFADLRVFSSQASL